MICTWSGKKEEKLQRENVNRKMAERIGTDEITEALPLKFFSMKSNRNYIQFADFITISHTL